MGKTSHNKFCMRTEVFGVIQKPGKITMVFLSNLNDFQQSS